MLRRKNLEIEGLRVDIKRFQQNTKEVRNLTDLLIFHRIENQKGLILLKLKVVKNNQIRNNNRNSRIV